MRSIPFKVVCLIGLNADAFPRDDHPLGFDLIARHPRPGDRSRRKDDKYLFLEALVSARRNLYISYVGQSIQDNSHIPPSVLVSELIENIAKGYGVPEGNLVVRHPLQAYSKRYFEEGEPELFSYSRENFIAAAGAGDSRCPVAVFYRTTFRTPGRISYPSTGASLSILHSPGALSGQAASPTSTSMSRISGLEDKENFNLDALGRYHLKQELLGARLSGHDLDDYFSCAKSQGRPAAGHCRTRPL